MRLPRKVGRGEEVRAEDFNALIDAIQAATLSPGVGYRRDITAAGTVLKITRQSRGQFVSDHPPFALRKIEEPTQGNFEITLEPGRVRSANPVQAANDGDGYDYFIPEIDGEPMDTRDADGNLPVLEVTDGEWIYVKIERDAEGVVVGTPEVVVDEAEKESAHYQPVNPDDSGTQEIDQYARILGLEVVDDVAEISVWWESDIEITPFLWAGENVGAGARSFKKHQDTTGRWQFRTITGCYGAKVEEDGDEIVMEPEAENAGDLQTGNKAAVYITREETEAAMDPADDICEQPMQFRQLAQGEDLLRQEITIVEDDDLVRIRGNNVPGKLVIRDCDNNLLGEIEWQDGLMKTSGTVEFQVSSCVTP